jgi:hypothetical protein
MSNMERPDPKRDIPSTVRVELSLTKFRRDIELPTWTKSRTERALEHRAKLRSDSELPSCKKSITDRQEPNRAKPKMVIVLDRRTKLRKDIELPM